MSGSRTENALLEEFALGEIRLEISGPRYRFFLGSVQSHPMASGQGREGKVPGCILVFLLTYSFILNTWTEARILGWSVGIMRTVATGVLAAPWLLEYKRLVLAA